MIQLLKRWLPLIMALCLLLSAAYGCASSEKPSATQDKTSERRADRAEEDEIELEATTGTLVRGNVSINASTGAMVINSFTVELENGDQIEALIIEGLLDSLVGGAVVKVEPYEQDSYHWIITEIVSLPEKEEEDEKPEGIDLNLSIFYPGSSYALASDAIAELLSNSLGGEVNLQFVPNDMFPMMLQAGELQAALINYTTFVKGIRQSGQSLASSSEFEILLASRRFESRMFISGSFIVPDFSDIETFEDCEGKTFIYPGVESLTGYYLTVEKIKSLGYNPDAFFGKTVSVNYNANEIGDRLLDGSADVGFLYAPENENALEDNGLYSGFRIIDTTPAIPEIILIVPSALPDEVKAAIANAFLDVPSTDRGKNVLDNLFNIRGFLADAERIAALNEILDSAFDTVSEMQGWE